MKYEILEHPSELRIRVYGKTLEELFSNAVLAMKEILKHNAKLQIKNANVAKEHIKIESIDLNSLLVDFLSEILARSQIKKAVYKVAEGKITIHCHPEPRAKDLIIGRKHTDEIPHSARNDKLIRKCLLEADIIGDPVDHFDEDIKAVTYEDLDIKKVGGIWQTVIVFDI